MKTAYEKDIELMVRLARAGIEISRDACRTLRHAEMTLHRWSEACCGNSDAYKSWVIIRHDISGQTLMEVHPHNGASYTYPVRDLESGALNRVAKICKGNFLYYYHQTDPRGCALYVSKEKLTDSNYNSIGVHCSVKTRKEKNIKVLNQSIKAKLAGMNAKQIRSLIRLIRRYERHPDNIVNYRDYAGVVYGNLFVGIEKDGYTHT